MGGLGFKKKKGSGLNIHKNSSKIDFDTLLFFLQCRIIDLLPFQVQRGQNIWFWSITTPTSVTQSLHIIIISSLISGFHLEEKWSFLLTMWWDYFPIALLFAVCSSVLSSPSFLCIFFAFFTQKDETLTQIKSTGSIQMYSIGWRWLF